MTAAPPTDRTDLRALLAAQRKAFAADPLPTAATRRDRLDRLLRMARVNARQIAEAINADFGRRPWQETLLAELAVFEQRLLFTRRHLPAWMRRRRVPTAAQYGLASNWLMPQPLGVVGVLSPWNYPFDLCMGPSIDALAAGNRVMIKPSELTPHFSALLAELVARDFNADELTVAQGDAELAARFCALPLDHLIFTGSTAVGRKVAAAAAPLLTPLTLELGGKSPVLVAPDAEIERAAERLAWGKLLNAGQTCIAPDYVLAPRASVGPLRDALARAMARLYPSLADNPDYCSIASDRQMARLQALLDDARAQGAQIETVNPAHERLDPARRILAPALVTGVHDRMRLMQEEIFGPILPILAYDDYGQALEAVAARERPLALYWFGRDRRRLEEALARTVSGGVSVNDCLLHASQVQQPFGGVGASGQGAHHGRRGFETFSHLKPVFVQSRWHGMALVSPPYGRLADLAWRFITGRSR
jgi:coniferyl-aldehyde dehydrogenase